MMNIAKAEFCVASGVANVVVEVLVNLVVEVLVTVVLVSTVEFSDPTMNW
jgi:hypothetical protein